MKIFFFIMEVLFIVPYEYDLCHKYIRLPQFIYLWYLQNVFDLITSDQTQLIYNFYDNELNAFVNHTSDQTTNTVMTP